MGTGFGETGPYAHKGGQDVLAQAMSGVMARTADPSHPMAIYPTALADYSAGMHMVQGILLALLQRERTGVGQKISVSLYNSMLAMQMQEAAMILMRDAEVNWAAMPLSGVFECADQRAGAGRCVQGQPAARHLRRAGARRTCRSTRASPTWSSSSRTRPNCSAQFRERFKTNTREHWLTRLEEQDLLCAPVRDMREVLVDRRRCTTR